MGLIKATIGATAGVLADQWKEYFYCDSMAPNVLMQKGERQQSRRGSNVKGEANIISNGSVIAVNDGQCAIIVEDGHIVEIACEPGRFVYDSSSEPSIFEGKFGQALVNSFKQIGHRITYGGGPGKDQRVYFINTKPIENNLFGSPTPIPFRFVDANVGADIDLHIRVRGRFSYTIADPIIFYTRIAANVSDTFSSANLLEQLRSEFISQLQVALAPLSESGIRPSELPGKTDLLVDEMNNRLKSKWLEMRGLQLFSIAFESVAVPDDEQRILTQLQQAKVLTNSPMAAASLAQAQADALRAAAQNQGAGAFMAFAGLNMLNGVAAASPQVPQSQVQTEAAADFETRLKRLELLKGKIPDELYEQKLKELLSEI